MRNRKIKNFTLIELLIVISIISILASLLLPVLKNAKEGAKKIACTNTQKNIAHATFMYVDDCNGFLPTCSDIYGLWRVNWVKQLAPYWGGNYTGSDWAEMMENKVISCPSTPHTILYARRDNSGYAFSYELMYTDPISLLSIKKPSATIIYGDTWDNFDDPTHYTNEYLYKWADKIGNRHNKGINVGYADGHVDWHPTSYLQSNDELYENN